MDGIKNRLESIEWMRIGTVLCCSIFWIQVSVIFLKTWPNGSVLNLELFYWPTKITPASIVFIGWLLMGFNYGALTKKNYAFLAFVVGGILCPFLMLGLQTKGLFPTLDSNSCLVFLALYVAACCSRFTAQLLGVVPNEDKPCEET